MIWRSLRSTIAKFLYLLSTYGKRITANLKNMFSAPKVVLDFRFIDLTWHCLGEIFSSMFCVFKVEVKHFMGNACLFRLVFVLLVHTQKLPIISLLDYYTIEYRPHHHFSWSHSFVHFFLFVSEISLTMVQMLFVSLQNFQHGFALISGVSQRVPHLLVKTHMPAVLYFFHG